MDNSSSNNANSNSQVTPDTAVELAHIAEEVYKKNFELAEKNKTLSLLRQIDEIVLSSVTDIRQISQQVSDAVVRGVSYRVMSIYLIENKESLTRVALSFDPSLAQLQNQIQDVAFHPEINLRDEKNFIVKSLIEQKPQTLEGIKPLLPQSPYSPDLSKIEGVDNIHELFINPLRIRGQILGVLIFGLAEKSEKTSQFQLDLMERLVDVVGIGLDSAMLYKELREANERLRELDRLKDEFVSLASHELRTPMTAIKSYLWMVMQGQGGPLNDKQKRYIERSYNSADRLIKLVNDMLNISRIDSGRLSIHVDSVDLKTITQEVIDEVAPRASELGLTIQFENPDTPPAVLADPDKIKEVIYNLIGNSMKFTPSGGKLTIAFEQKDDMINTIVRDTGSGISPENISKLFQKFGILPGTYVANQPTFGTGLGLYICKSIVALHGGKIWAESEGKGKGASFAFSLKLFSAEEMKKLNEKFSQSPSSGIGLVHSKII